MAEIFKQPIGKKLASYVGKNIIFPFCLPVTKLVVLEEKYRNKSTSEGEHSSRALVADTVVNFFTGLAMASNEYFLPIVRAGLGLFAVAVSNVDAVFSKNTSTSR